MESRFIPRLWPVVGPSGRIVVTSHANPDGDSVAGLLALTESLRLAQRDARAVSPSPIPPAYRFLPGWDSVEIYSREEGETAHSSGARELLLAAEAIICLDCGDLGRLGPLYQDHRGKFESAPLVNIDHHASNTGFGSTNLVDPAAGSVCEYLAVLMERDGLPLSEQVSETLLAGIVSDTQGFRTPSTSASTLRIAASLVERGAHLSTVTESLFNTRSAGTLSLWGRALCIAQVEGGFVSASISRQMLQECGAKSEDAHNLVDFLSGVPGSGGAFLFSESEEDGKIEVSIRTSDLLDAADLARSFGGGGHRRAAGCTIAGTLGDVRSLVMGEARQRLGLVAAGG